MGHHQVRNDPAMRQAREFLLITAIFCCSSSHSLSSPTRVVALRNNVVHSRGTSTLETQQLSYGVKVEMQRMEVSCELREKTGDGGDAHSDHQRLRCAVHRSSLRAQEVRKAPRMMAGGGSKAVGGAIPPGSSTAGKFVMQLWGLDFVIRFRGYYLHCLHVIFGLVGVWFRGDYAECKGVRWENQRSFWIELVECPFLP